MGRPTTKADLLTASQDNFNKLMELITSMSETELTTPFKFQFDEKKKEAHWRRDVTLRDVLIHLYEWHQLVLKWVKDNTNGIQAPFLPAPYSWKTTAEMNQGFWEKHQNTSE